MQLGHGAEGGSRTWGNRKRQGWFKGVSQQLSSIPLHHPASLYLKNYLFLETKQQRKPTFTSLHSRESEKAGNISSYFCTASWVTRGRILEASPSLLECNDNVCATTYLRIQHVHTEVTQRCLEEVILGTVLQQRTVHRVGSDLEITQYNLKFATTDETSGCRLLASNISPAHRFQSPLGTAPAELRRLLLSGGTCLLNWKGKSRSFLVHKYSQESSHLQGQIMHLLKT